MKEHKIQIRRQENTEFLPPRIQQDMVMRIGSVLDGRGPLRGVTGEEEKELLSRVMGVQPTDPRFDEKAENFWASLTIHVESGGAILDITTNEDGEPKDPEQYVKYLWAKKHPKVADTKEDMLRNPNVWFYIHDPEIAKKKSSEETKARKEAYAAMIEVSDDVDTSRAILRVMGTMNPDSLDKDLVEVELEKYAKSEPKKFLAAATDKNLKLRNEILTLVDKGVLSRVGNAVYFIDDLLGNTMEETIKFFKNKKNSETVNAIRAKLEEAKV